MVYLVGLVFWLKVERAGIDAITLAGGLVVGVIKDMSQMSAAVGADRFSALHAQ